MDALYAVAGGAALVDGEGLRNDVLPLQVSVASAIDAFLFRLDELLVLAQDLGPFFLVVPELPEGFFMKPYDSFFASGPRALFAMILAYW